MLLTVATCGERRALAFYLTRTKRVLQKKFWVGWMEVERWA
jgi:hypothetical protein